MDIIQQRKFLDTAWLSNTLCLPVVSARLADEQAKFGGMSAEMIFFEVEIGQNKKCEGDSDGENDGGNAPVNTEVVRQGKEEGAAGLVNGIEAQSAATEILPLVIKYTVASTMRAAMGTAREALFYEVLLKEHYDNDHNNPLTFGKLFPKCYFAFGNMATGESVVILERVADHVPMGVFFGSGNPNNWSIRDKLQGMVQCYLPSVSHTSESSSSSSSPFSSLNSADDSPAAVVMSIQAFKVYAKLHATHWNSSKLLKWHMCMGPRDAADDDNGGTSESRRKGFPRPWLRGADWITGDGQEAWEVSQGMAAGWWNVAVAERYRAATPNEKKRSEFENKAIETHTGEVASNGIQWDEHLFDCLTHSFAEASWVRFQEEIRSRPFTLVHGDCHPHNILWVIGEGATNSSNSAEGDGYQQDGISATEQAGGAAGTFQPRGKDQHTKPPYPLLIDFEMIGIGSPAQDIGQFMISHMDPNVRRVHEKTLLRLYYEELLANGVGKTFSFEECWGEYVDGGFGRWAWFIAFFLGSGTHVPVAVKQFFHDQLAEFARDHIRVAANAPMPRV